jgi:ribosomal-protein-alanine N-acetyltransferase
MTDALSTARLHLREPDEHDVETVRVYFDRNTARIEMWGAGSVSIATARNGEWIGWRRSQSRLGCGRSYLAFSGTELAGIVDLDGISAGPPASAMIGYSIDASFEGRGIASEAVGSVVRHAFEALNLDLLVAYYHPANARSGALLRRAGFQVQAVLSDVPPDVRALMRPQVMAMLHVEAWRERSQAAL